jgi:hypothetical protein
MGQMEGMGPARSRHAVSRCGRSVDRGEENTQEIIRVSRILLSDGSWRHSEDDPHTNPLRLGVKALSHHRTLTQTGRARHSHLHPRDPYAPQNVSHAGVNNGDFAMLPLVTLSTQRRHACGHQVSETSREESGLLRSHRQDPAKHHQPVCQSHRERQPQAQEEECPPSCPCAVCCGTQVPGKSQTRCKRSVDEGKG